MDSIYLTDEELPGFPVLDMAKGAPYNPGVYRIPMGNQWQMAVVVEDGISHITGNVVMVASPEERSRLVAARNPKLPVEVRMEDLVPEYAAELMTQFVKRKDLADRQKVRRRFKALLDLFSADTVWPANRPEARPRPHIGGGAFAYQGGAQMMANAHGDGPPAQPEDIAVEPQPPDALPAPGAPLADHQG